MKRTKEDAEITRQNILNAALKVFYDKGVTRATLSQVAKEAEVTRGAVYWHFKDKFDLYVTLYENLTRKYQVRPIDYTNKNYSSLDEFKSDIKRLFESFEYDKQYHMFIQIMYSRMEYVDDMKPIVDNEIEKQKETIKAFERALTSLQTKKEVSSDINCNLYARILFTFIDGALDSWGIDDDIFTGDCTVYHLLDEHFKYLKP